MQHKSIIAPHRYTDIAWRYPKRARCPGQGISGDFL